MTLLFMDGCDHYGVRADIEDKYDVVDGTTQVAPANTGGAFGGGYIGISTDDTALRKDITASTTTYFQGYFYFDTADTFGTDNLIVTYDSAVGAQAWLRTVDSGGTIEARTTAGVIGTSINTLTKSQWLFFELKIVVSDTVGELLFKVDGVEFLNLTSADTQSTGNANVARYAFYAPGTSGIDCRWDDIMIMNDSGSKNNGFLGAHRIQTLYPDGDTATLDFTPTGAGTTNADRVDDGDTGPDGDTTYVESSTIGHKDLYTMDDMTTGDIGTIAAVQIGTVVSKDDAGAKTARNLIKSGVTTTNGGTFSPTNGVYTLELDLYEDNPTSAGTWTTTEVDGVEVGQEVVS